MYNSGNRDKHTTKNPLKRAMVNHFNEKMINLIDQVIPSETFTLLDAGCGEGYISELISNAFPRANITGVDLSREALNLAPENSRVSYLQGDVTNLDFDNEAFDIVLCSEVLEHLQHPEMALQEVKRVSKKSVICTVPNEPWFRLGNLLVLKNVSRFGNPPDHINHYTFKQIKRFAEKVLGHGVDSTSIFPWSVIYWENGSS